MREAMAHILLLLALASAAYSIGRTNGARMAREVCMDGIDRILEEVTR
jgi:hypothetical protein